MWAFNIGRWTVEVPYLYPGLALSIQVLIRAVMTALRAWELVDRPTASRTKRENRDTYGYVADGFWKTWRLDFLSRHPSATVKDYLHPSIIGFVELMLYPPLIANGKWIVIGGWIATKTAVQWPTWADQRSTYNRFLIGNAFVIAASCWMATLVTIY
jgi:hypothetical protein